MLCCRWWNDYVFAPKVRFLKEKFLYPSSLAWFRCHDIPYSQNNSSSFEWLRSRNIDTDQGDNMVTEILMGMQRRGPGCVFKYFWTAIMPRTLNSLSIRVPVQSQQISDLACSALSLIPLEWVEGAQLIIPPMRSVFSRAAMSKFSEHCKWLWNIAAVCGRHPNISYFSFSDPPFWIYGHSFCAWRTGSQSKECWFCFPGEKWSFSVFYWAADS